MARFVFVQFERIMVGTSQLSVVAETAGPASGWPVLLLHGFPYDPWSYLAVADGLAAAGGRVVAPYLRGFARPGFCRMWYLGLVSKRRLVGMRSR